MALIQLENANGADIYINPDHVLLLEEGDQRGTTKLWSQRSDDAAYEGNCVLISGTPAQVAYSLNNY